MRALLLGSVVLVSLAACDFTPTLDIDTPDFVPGLTVRSVLVADSTVVVYLDESWDPYQDRPAGNRTSEPETIPAVVTLSRNGVVIETLTVRAEECYDWGPDPDTTPSPEAYECGPYVGVVPVEAGATYTVRAEAEGWPVVEGTVTVPRRPTLDVVEETAEADDNRRFRVRLSDPAGLGDRYGLTLYSYATVGYGVICENGVCRDTTFAIQDPDFYPLSFDTSDPVILSAAAEIAGSGISFASFPDDTFDGREKTFTISPSGRYAQGYRNSRLRVQVAALSADLYDAYRISYFSGGQDNPFAEPVNLPTNVVGGYGMVGAVTLAEVTFAPRE